MTTEQHLFIEKFAPLMQAQARARGYKIISTALAQTIIEGNWGKSILARDYHNHWGLKCGSSWKGKAVRLSTKEEYTAGTLTNIKDYFRAYSTDEEGVKGYYDFINTKRYANLKTAETYQQYAQYLKADGYATSSTYVNTLINTVNKFNLYGYDFVETVSTFTGRPILSRGFAYSEYNLELQQLLNLKGNYHLDEDGYFGRDTRKAVLDYQDKHHLKVDGIVGSETWKSLLS